MLRLANEEEYGWRRDARGGRRPSAAVTSWPATRRPCAAPHRGPSATCATHPGELDGDARTGLHMHAGTGAGERASRAAMLGPGAAASMVGW
jgi:hypothetical protein